MQNNRTIRSEQDFRDLRSNSGMRCCPGGQTTHQSVVKKGEPRFMGSRARNRSIYLDAFELDDRSKKGVGSNRLQTAATT